MDDVSVTLRVPRGVRDHFRSAAKGNARAYAALMRNILERSLVDAPEQIHWMPADTFSLAAAIWGDPPWDDLNKMLRFVQLAKEGNL